MFKKVCILNYGSGNVKSVFNMLSLFNCEVVISNEVDDVRSSTHLILPGVSSFGSAMDRIRTLIPLDIVSEEVFQKRKPFFGICVGMQVLATKGYEFGERDGLGWIEGEVKKISVSGLSLPHVGWNEVLLRKPSNILQGISSSSDFYFVHSYSFMAKYSEHVITET